MGSASKCIGENPAWVSAAMSLNSACTPEVAKGPSERGDGVLRTCQQRSGVRLHATARSASESLLLATVDDIDQRIPDNWATHRWLETSSRILVSYRKSRSSSQAHVGKTVAPWKCLSHSAVLDPMAEIIEARERTMVDNDNNKRRRLVEFKDGCRYGKFGKTKAYELIAHERIRAYKMGGKTMIDLDSVDEYHASLPRLEARASYAADLHSETAGAPLRRLPRRLD
jgi:hypothetical protein